MEIKDIKYYEEFIEDKVSLKEETDIWTFKDYSYFNGGYYN